MLRRIGKAATELLNYSNGVTTRCETLRRIQGLGYSEQTVIFLLELLEDCADESYPDPGGGDPDSLWKKGETYRDG